MYSIDNGDQEPTKPPGSSISRSSSSSPPPPWKRRSFLRRRWVKVTCTITTLTLFAFYFCYYYYYRHHHHQQAVSALNTLITSVTHINTSNDGNSEGLKLEHEHLPAPDFIHDQYLSLDTWNPDHVTRGVLYMIVRNENLPDARAAMRTIQDRFNDHAKYPWILLNDQYFNADFKRHASSIVAGKNISISFGKIDSDAWSYPWWIDVPRVEQSLENNERLFSFQRLRYQTGLVFYHPLFLNVEYAWRIDPGVLYTCTLNEDPFTIMKNEQKKIGFILTTKGDKNVVRTLWPSTINFIQKHPEWIKSSNQTIMPWVIPTIDNHYWYIQSNFEIIDLNFVRSEPYQTYFDYLDKTGGFFYERWDDSVRTLAAAMFLNKKQIHFFDKIGYSKKDQSHCPLQSNYDQICACDLTKSHDLSDNSGTLDLLRYIAPTTFDAVINFAESKIPHNVKIDLNNTHVLKQVIKQKDALTSFFEA